jgi:hypothetical protein
VEPKPPSRTDEILSRRSLRSSPWVRRRIKHLNLVGKRVKGWTPPVFADSIFTGRRRPPS